ncbi:25S rRNA (adenine645-N1)-methyltransferase [Thoreauomyces humboldtii]|nr:25S rRNA (adenine645-N1)-methyltransferase [Thoreauomyces humboldtii]
MSGKRDRAGEPTEASAKKQKVSNARKDRLKKVGAQLNDPVALQKSKSIVNTAQKEPTSIESESAKAAPKAKTTNRSATLVDAQIAPPKSADRGVKQSTNLTELQEKMQKKLAGSKFRWLNEILYTKDSSEAVQIFGDKPELFDIYHEGFRSQTESWPTNPVDIFLDYLSRKPQGTIVADMGCGDAKIARTLNSRNSGIDVQSFDLVKRCTEVTACDIAHVPMETATADIVVFCLSLMGTNFMDFVREAYRILRPDGELKIAEVISRFPDVSAFEAALVETGFKFVKKNDSNKMFILFDFVKSDPKHLTSKVPQKLSKTSETKRTKPKRGRGDAQHGTPPTTKPDKPEKPVAAKPKEPLLKPCIYKRR